MGKTQAASRDWPPVNSALDNPTNYFTASSLNGPFGDLGQLLDSVSNAVQTISAADKGISSITKLVESAQATARQALQTAATVVTTPASAAVAHAPVVGGAYTAGSVTASSITINGTSITTTASMTQTDFMAAINAQTATTGVTAADNGSGVTLTATTSGSGNPNGNINIGGTITGTGLTAGTNAGTAAVAEVTGANPKREELLGQYNELLTQIDDLAKDASFNGVNLLDGDNLEVLFNEDGTSKLNVSGVTFNAAGLGLTALSAGDFDANADINATLSDLKGGIDTLRYAGLEVRFEPVGRRDPSGLHQEHDQCSRDRRREPDPRGHQRRSGEPARPADPSAAVLDRSVAGLAGRPAGPTPVLKIALAIEMRKAGFGPPSVLSVAVW
jgi:flagellin